MPVVTSIRSKSSFAKGSGVRLANVRYSFELVLAILAMALLPIDTLNGFFLHEYSTSYGVSLIAKSIFLFLLSFYVLIFYRKGAGVLYFLVTFGFVAGLVRWGGGHVLDGLLKDALAYIKIISLFFVYYSFSNFRCLSPYTFYKYFYFIVTFGLIFNIGVTLFGYGEQSYSGYGAKGFMYAGNTLSSLVVMVCGLGAILCFSKRSIWMVLSFFVSLLLAMLVGTKSSVGGVIILTVITFLFMSFFSLNKRMFFLFLLICFGFFVFSSLNVLVSEAFLERVEFFYESGGIKRVLLSDRDLFVSSIYPFFVNDGISGILFGISHDTLQFIHKPLVEIDPIDMLFRYGVIGFFVYYLLFAVVIFEAGSKKTGGELESFSTKMVLFTVMVIFLISSVAGHVAMNGAVTPYLAVVLALPKWFANFSSATNGRLSIKVQ